MQTVARPRRREQLVPGEAKGQRSHRRIDIFIFPLLIKDKQKYKSTTGHILKVLPSHIVKVLKHQVSAVLSGRLSVTLEESVSCSMPDRPSHTQQGWAKGLRGPVGGAQANPTGSKSLGCS